MVNYVTLATSMGGWGVAIGGVTYVTRNIYGGGGACQDMQSDVHCLVIPGSAAITVCIAQPNSKSV